MSSLDESQCTHWAFRHRIDDAQLILGRYLRTPDPHQPIVTHREYVACDCFAHTMTHALQMVGLNVHTGYHLSPRTDRIHHLVNSKYYRVLD